MGYMIVVGNSPREAQVACGCQPKGDEEETSTPSEDEYTLMSVDEIINGKVFYIYYSGLTSKQGKPYVYYYVVTYIYPMYFN